MTEPLAYFETVPLTPGQAQDAWASARTQEAKLAAYCVLKHRQGRQPEFTPSGIAPLFPKAPLTSVRRAITQLTKRQFLTKTTETRTGQYGKPEHVWTLSDAAIRAMRPTYKQLSLEDLL